jgi:hypothetical protein
MSDDQAPRGPHGRRRYAMDYIGDKTLYAAVMFALKMMREGTPPDVARYTGQAGGTSAGRKRRR